MIGLHSLTGPASSNLKAILTPPFSLSVLQQRPGNTRLYKKRKDLIWGPMYCERGLLALLGTCSRIKQIWLTLFLFLPWAGRAYTWENWGWSWELPSSKSFEKMMSQFIFRCSGLCIWEFHLCQLDSNVLKNLTCSLGNRTWRRQNKQEPWF